MKSRKRLAAIVLAGSIFSIGGVIAIENGIASAHTGTSHSEDCTNVSAHFDNFPATGDNVISITSPVKTVSASFTGASGDVSATWSSLGVDTSKGGTVTVSYSWLVDGGGNYGPFNFDASSCKPAYNPMIVVTKVKCADNVATIQGNTSGFPDGDIVIAVEQGDNGYGQTAPAPPNQAFSISVNITNADRQADGSILFHVSAYANDGSGTRLAGPADAVVQEPNACAPAPPADFTFTAQVVCAVQNNAATYTLSVTQTSGDQAATFTPANGSSLPNGNAVDVVGTLGAVTHHATASAASDCTPVVIPPVVVPPVVVPPVVVPPVVVPTPPVVTPTPKPTPTPVVCTAGHKLVNGKCVTLSTD